MKKKKIKLGDCYKYLIGSGEVSYYMYIRAIDVKKEILYQLFSIDKEGWIEITRRSLKNPIVIPVFIPITDKEYFQAFNRILTIAIDYKIKAQEANP